MGVYSIPLDFSKITGLVTTLPKEMSKGGPEVYEGFFWSLVSPP